MIHLGVFEFFQAALSKAGSIEHYPPLEPVATACAASQIQRWRQFDTNFPLVLSVIRFTNLDMRESKCRRIADRP
jgi:hypothetical protein